MVDGTRENFQAIDKEENIFNDTILTAVFTAVKIWKCCMSNSLTPMWRTPISGSAIHALPMWEDTRIRPGKKEKSKTVRP
jgi:hypothetical protein